MELTVGVNTYNTLEEAETYFASRPFSTVWTEANDDALKIGALIMAAKHLDLSYEWKGTPTDEDQTMAFPRSDIYTRNGAEVASDTIPTAIKEAQLELAFQWVQADQLTPDGGKWTSSDTTAAKGPLQREKLGDMERWYHEPTGSVHANIAGYAAIRKQYPLVDLLVKPYILGTTNSMFKDIIN